MEARETKNWAKEYDLLIEQSKVSTDPDTKLALIEQALALARSQKDEARTEGALGRREKIAPRFNRKPDPQDWIGMAHDFRRARQFKTARSLFQKAAKSKKLGEARQLSALRGLAQVHKLERNREAHIQTLQILMKRTKPPAKSKYSPSWRAHYEAVINLARAQWTIGEVSTARKLLESSLKTFNKKLPRTEIFWLLGRMAEERDDYQGAIDLFNLANGESTAPSEIKEKVLWYLGWNQRKLGHWDEAILALDQGRQKSVNGFSRTRFLYWLARTYKDSDRDPEMTKRLYEELIVEDPLGYYGLLAHRDLGRPIRRTAATGKPPPHPSGLREIMDPRIFEWLVSVEEFDIAQQLLDHAAEILKHNRSYAENEATWSDLFHAYARAGAYQHLYERLGRLSPDQRQSILAQSPELLFPQPYRDAVTTSAEKFQLPPELLFSIMRQESSFNPKARSPADAFGLMQLLPEVAEASAPSAEVAFAKAEDLFNPHVNIPLGAYHLRQLWDRFTGRFILAVASYNASERSIRTWMQVRYKSDPTAFIEDVPYEETRGYIRLVLRNMIFYQLYNHPTGEMPFPEWVLNLDKDQASQ